MRHKNQKKHALSEQSLNALKKNCTHIAVRKENIARDPGGRRWGDYVEFAGRNGSKTVVLPIDDVRQMKWRKQRFGVRPLNLLDNELDSEMLLKEIRKYIEADGYLITGNDGFYHLIKKDMDLELLGSGGFANVYFQKSTWSITQNSYRLFC